MAMLYRWLFLRGFNFCDLESLDDFMGLHLCGTQEHKLWIRPTESMNI